MVNFFNMQKQKAIFWDRDGVLNHTLPQRDDGEKNVAPQKFEDFKLVEGIKEVLQEVRLLDFFNIVVTNQPDITRNKMSWEELNRMNDFLKAGIPTIEAVYVCPHDRTDNCNCRKPKPGLLLDAAKDFNLDLTKCYMVGDSQSDIDAGKTAGVKTILIKANYNSKVINFDFTINKISEIISLLK